MKTLILISVIALCSLDALSQSTVTIARKKLYAAGDVSLFIDGKFYCSVSNNKFVTLSLPAGEHSFACQWDGKTIKKTSESDAVKLNVIAGAEYFLTFTTEERGIKKALILQEVTLSTYQKVKQDLSEQNCN